MKLNNIDLITKQGTVTLNGELKGSNGNYSLEVDDYEFSDKAANLIGGVYEASQIFFVDEIDLTDEVIDDDIIDELIEIMAQGSFNNTAKAIAIKEYTNSEFSDISEVSDTEFTVNGDGEYFVMTDDEADEAAKEGALNSIEEFGLDGFSPWAKNYALENFVDTDWFDDAMKESYENYAYDIQSESASEPYVNRLHEEMVELNIMDEPEWPEEPDEDDFTHEREDWDDTDWAAEEPEESDFDTEEEFNSAYEKWEDEKDELEKEHDDEQDRLEEEAQEKYDAAYEEWENETEKYRSELESDVENNIEEFVDKKIDGEDGYEWWNDNIGGAEKVVKDNGLLDEEAFAEWLIDQDGRGSFIANYNGQENEETVTYKGDTETFYIYRAQ